tara:strand:- start:1021 stop:1191 length:171 start_codon:yes stop_codon:yes gene_type:complete
MHEEGIAKLAGAIAERKKTVGIINKLQKDLHNGKIDITGFYIEIITMKEDLENGII